jgi:hypothetical protein
MWGMANVRLHLEEGTKAGRLGLELLAVRAANAEARERGDLGEVERLEEREQAITIALVREVTAVNLNFGVLGIGRPAGRTATRGGAR